MSLIHSIKKSNYNRADDSQPISEQGMNVDGRARSAAKYRVQDITTMHSHGTKCGGGDVSKVCNVRQNVLHLRKNRGHSNVFKHAAYKWISSSWVKPMCCAAAVISGIAIGFFTYKNMMQAGHFDGSSDHSEKGSSNAVLFQQDDFSYDYPNKLFEYFFIPACKMLDQVMILQPNIISRLFRDGKEKETNRALPPTVDLRELSHASKFTKSHGAQHFYENSNIALSASKFFTPKAPALNDLWSFVWRKYQTLCDGSTSNFVEVGKNEIKRVELQAANATRPAAGMDYDTFAKAASAISVAYSLSRYLSPKNVASKKLKIPKKKQRDKINKEKEIKTNKFSLLGKGGNEEKEIKTDKFWLLGKGKLEFLIPPQLDQTIEHLGIRDKITPIVPARGAQNGLRRAQRRSVLQVDERTYQTIQQLLRLPIQEQRRMLRSLISPQDSQLVAFVRGIYNGNVLIHNINSDESFRVAMEIQDKKMILKNTDQEEDLESSFDMGEMSIERQWAAEGRQLYQRIRNGQNNLVASEYTICTLLWALMEAAEKKNEKFQAGSFTLNDPNQNLWRYLKKIGHSRFSSHLKGIPNQQIIGINNNLDPSKGEYCYLPGGDKRHVLVHQYSDLSGNPRLLIKPEAHGVTNLVESIWHGKDWVKNSLQRWWSGKPQEEGERKERVDPRLVEEFHTLANRAARRNPAYPAPIRRELRTWGVQLMHRHLNQLSPWIKKLQQGNEDERLLANDLRSFQTKLNKLGDHQKDRFASEVILDDEIK